MKVLSELKPFEVFRYFEEICAIPHGSGNTKAISDYCVRFAKEHGLTYRQDASNNVVIWKPATPGYEDKAPVMLQGHLDMVCEKEPDCDIDFDNDGLTLQLEDGLVSAKGTTLGADDGIAIAYSLAILASKDIPHPPLEIVFTVDEEIGMFGAADLDCSDLKARTMLNIDSEEEGYLLVSCAGGVTVKAEIPTEYEKAIGCQATLSITGLQGGHSGVEINKGRYNACQLLGRTLYYLGRTAEIRLLEVSGGLKDNAIPREAKAIILVDQKDSNSCLDKTEQLLEKLKQELRITDPGVKISLDIAKEESEVSVMTLSSSHKVVSGLLNFPGGVQAMSFSIPGLVQTSLNLGILKTKENVVSYSFSVRSSIESEKEALVEKITCLAEALGGKVQCTGEYPAWEYREESPLREVMTQVYKEKYGKEPVVEALHAGLECGILSAKLPGLDCVSFGPDIMDIHTPKERMDVASVERTWEYILEVLKRL